MEEEEEDDGVYSYGGGGSGSGNKFRKKGQAKPPQVIKLTESDDKYPPEVPPKTKNIDFEWSEESSVLREVIDQGDRRTCWTIPTTRSLSGRLVIDKKFDPPLRLSALHLLVALIDKVDSKGGLQNLEHLRKFLIDYGTVLEEDCECPQLALESKNDVSKPNPVLCTEQRKGKHTRVFKVQDLIILDKVDEKELICLVNKGPVAVTINVHEDFLSFKGDGIYPGPSQKSRRIDKHLLTVYGYGTALPEGIHYWKVQNSAGKKWGNQGYGKIVRQISRGEGTGSLFTSILYPRLLDNYEGQRGRF